jgi:hypothetical protein
MLFASFSETVQNSDPWVLALFSAIPLIVKFLAGKFPAFAWLWAMVERFIPSPPPPDPAKPTLPADPKKITIADVARLLLELLAKKNQATTDEKEALQAVAAELAKQ